MSKELRAKTRWTRPTESWPLVCGLEILHIRKGEQPQTHQVFMALRWVITSLPHKHVCPLALGAFLAMAVQLSDNLDPWGCTRRHRGSKQVWFVARHHPGVQTIYTIPSHNALLCQDNSAEHGGGWGVEAEQARYSSRNSPETKKLFFTATESTCMCGCFTWTVQQALVSNLFELVHMFFAARHGVKWYMSGLWEGQFTTMIWLEKRK